MASAPYASRLVVVVVVVALSLGSANGGSVVDFNYPVRSAAEDEITQLPGLTFKPNFKQYSGYLEADDQKNRFWHYWFVESQAHPKKDPLVLWLNGGPGCSSLLGLLTELGPYRIGDNNTLISNPYAWNRRANIIFMESPAGVGYTYAVNGDISANDDTTAKQNYLALKSFLRKFPEYKDRPLYLTGESYGGVYLPTLAVLVDADPEMQLHGVAIGNGYLDANKLAEALVYFSYYHGLIGRTNWDGLSKECCGGKPPARGNCNFMSANRSKACSDFVVKATDNIIQSGLNPYNLYDECASTSSVSMLRGDQQTPINYNLFRENVDKKLILTGFNLTETKRQSKRTKHSRVPLALSRKQQQLDAKLGLDPPCIDDSSAVNYMNQRVVRQALHIPDGLKTPFATCSNINYAMIYPLKEGGLAPQMHQLINSKRDLTLLVYNGDVDLMCNFFGDEWFVDDLGVETVSEYAPWYTDHQLSGFAKHYKGISYFTVKGSGHMVPTDRPAEAFNMFEKFLHGLKR